MTHLNAPRQGPRQDDFAPQLAGPEVWNFDQAVALVIAESFEQARHAARLIRVSYDREPGRFSLRAEQANAVKPAQWDPDTAAGDFAAGFAAAPVKVDTTYTTPDQSHTMMEPHATIARWEGDRLTVWTSNQMVHWAVRDLAGTLLVPPENIRVVSAYVGGGFGAKLWIQSAACEALRRKLAQAAGFNPETAVFEGGRRAVSLASLAGAQGVSAEDRIVFEELEKKYAQASFGGHFCEVAVDRRTGEVRVRRLLSVATAGRILNPKTAHSQCLGGMAMGIGSALMEDAVVDPRLGYFVNHDMAGYHVPVHADRARGDLPPRAGRQVVADEG